MSERKLTQDLYVRVCKDSGYHFDAVHAAQFTASILGIHPLEVWMAMPDFSTMQRIAAGKHPACNRTEPNP